MTVSPYYIDEPTRLRLMAHARMIRARLAMRRATRNFAQVMKLHGQATAEASVAAFKLRDALQDFGRSRYEAIGNGE